MIVRDGEIGDLVAADGLVRNHGGRDGSVADAVGDQGVGLGKKLFAGKLNDVVNFRFQKRDAAGQRIAQGSEGDGVAQHDGVKAV